MQPMNNRQGGRRRGRNNNQRPQGGSPRGGGDSGNRIDSRARGNAAQLLEKYRNLARESQMSGDRVQTEYYLQFADHYFRVLADTRSRQEEQRSHRGEDRGDDRGDDRYDDDRADIGIVPPFGFGDEGDQSDSRQDDDRDARGDDRGNRGGRDRDGRDREGRDREGRRPRDDRGDYGNRNDRGERNDRARSERSDRPERAPRDTDAAAFDGEPTGRDGGDDDGVAPVPRRNGLRPRRRSLAEDAVNEDGPAGIDHAVLPPAIGVAAMPETGTDDVQPAPRRRTRSRKVSEEAAAED